MAGARADVARRAAARRAPTCGPMIEEFLHLTPWKWGAGERRRRQNLAWAQSHDRGDVAAVISSGSPKWRPRRPAWEKAILDGQIPVTRGGRSCWVGRKLGRKPLG